MEKQLKRFDIVLVDYGNDVIDSEQGGKRPSLIIQNDTGNLHSTTTIVMPLTSKTKNLNQPTHALIKSGVDKGLELDSIILGECIRQISEKRILRFLGKITDEEEKKQVKKVYLANFGE